MFSKASLVLHKIHQTFKFVPVTTRTLDQFNRICFKNVQPDLAIVANGGMILVNGELDLEWNKHIQDTLKSITPFDVMKRKVEHLSELEGFKKNSGMLMASSSILLCIPTNMMLLLLKLFFLMSLA